MTKQEYKGFEITRKGGAFDYRVTFDIGLPTVRTRFGTLAEIKNDIDLFLQGMLPPKAMRF